MSIGQFGNNEGDMSGSSTRDSFEEGSSFDFSDHERLSSSSSDDEYDVDSLKSPVMPLTPVKRPPSSPEIVITKVVQPAETELGAGRRPRMRLDLSSLPPAMASNSLASPRPGLSSRFSSDDGLSVAAAAQGITPGTESALSAFGIAPSRPSPIAAYPTPPLRPRRRFTDAFSTPELDSSSPPRRRPSPQLSPTTSMQRVRSADSSFPSSPMLRVQSAEASIPRSPLLDFGHARALYHSILPGDHRLLRSGETPGLAVPATASYFSL